MELFWSVLCALSAKSCGTVEVSWHQAYVCLEGVIWGIGWLCVTWITNWENSFRAPKVQANCVKMVEIICEYEALKHIINWHDRMSPVLLSSPSRKMQFFGDCCGQKSFIMRLLFLKNAMEYVGVLCSFMWWNCRNLLKLRELAKLAKSCKNCKSWQKMRFHEKRKKSDSRNTLF